MKRFFCLILAVCLMICSLAACDLKILFNEMEFLKDEYRIETNNDYNFKNYDNIIKIYSEIVDDCIRFDLQKQVGGEYEKNFQFDTEKEKEWYNTLFRSCLDFRYKTDLEFGYSVGDINGDGVDELLLLLEDYTLIAVFTLYNDSPNLLMSFGDDRFGCINRDGTIYAETQTDAINCTNYVYEISQDRSELIITAGVGKDSFNLERRTGCYFLVGKEKVFFSEEEYHTILNEQLYDNLTPTEYPKVVEYTALSHREYDREAFSAFYDAVDNNPYDKEYKRLADEGLLSYWLMASYYYDWWNSEFITTLNEMRVLFDNEEEYLDWKNGVLVWYDELNAECNSKIQAIHGTLWYGSMTHTYAELIRLKVIEWKYYIYAAKIAKGNTNAALEWYTVIE